MICIICISNSVSYNLLRLLTSLYLAVFCWLMFHEVDGAWSIWSGWGSCSRTCGDGTRIRSRSCTNPAPLHGGHYCYGHYQESMPCYLMSCPGEFHTILPMLLAIQKRYIFFLILKTDLEREFFLNCFF